MRGFATGLAALLVLRRTIAGLLLASLAGCSPIESGDPPEVASSDYYLRVVVLDVNSEEANRNLVCTVRGYSGDAIVNIRDQQTGQDRPYEITIDDIAFKSPQMIRLQVSTKNLTSVYVRCGTLGSFGDTIQCEPLTPALRIANLIPGRDRTFDESVRGHQNIYCEVQIIVPVGG